MLAAGLLQEEGRKKALTLQQQHGEMLGRILEAEGIASRLAIYKSIAAQVGLEFVDLLADPPQPTLLHESLAEEYLTMQAMPWKLDKDVMVIATAQMTAHMQQWATARYGEKRHFVITTPYDIRRALQKRFGTWYDHHSRMHLFELRPHQSARPMRTQPEQTISLALLAICLLALCATHSPSLAALMLVAQIFYVATLYFKVMLFVKGGRYIFPEPTPIESEHQLPIYTVLVPVYKEAQSLPRLFAALDALDYPKSKLDVKLIMEEDDSETIAMAKQLRPSGSIDIVLVPYSLPRTKPKACNYALRFAQGEFVTIYDAEDQPDPQQLKKAVAAFRAAPENVACLQARLNYYNKNENLLTKLFAIEYAAWFDHMLRGLQAYGVPIPLGGTSNHIALKKLRDAGEWDPYNVTEDADLGIRLELMGYKTQVFDSITLEEAPLTLRAWMKQRSRWIKGYMQTWLVHMRAPVALYKHFGALGFFGFQLFIGGPCLVFLLAPVLWLISGLWAAGYIGETALLPEEFLLFAVINLLFGLLSHLYFALAILSRKQWKGMTLAALLFPFYWVLHSFAGIKAAWQLLIKPDYWEKTSHGLSRISQISTDNPIIFHEFKR